MVKGKKKKETKKEKREKMKAREEKRLKKEKERKESMGKTWTKEERMFHTSNVLDKMKKLGLGIYEEEMKFLEMVIDNYVYKNIECETVVPIKVTKREIFINLKMTRQEHPTIKLQSSVH